jgi:hypothetical protein
MQYTETSTLFLCVCVFVLQEKLGGQNANFLNITVVGTYSYRRTLNG